MPTYEYKCQTCGHQFDVFQSMKDDRLTDCPQEDCDGELKRLIGTGAGIIFKGSGFYETDYRSASYKAGEKAESSSSSDSKPKKESSGSKSETKSPAKESKPKSTTPAKTES